jgi:hypothetical protein
MHELGHSLEIGEADDDSGRLPLIVITANSFIDGVERRRFSGSHHRHGSSRRYRLAVITISEAPTGSPLTLDPTSADTDGDGRSDSEELGELTTCTVQLDIPEVDTYACYKPRTNPVKVDSDDDGLADGTERDGWPINVVTRNGDPYAWAGAREQRADTTITVRSDPLDEDTDGDGLTDFEENRSTHTDPNATQTYRITRTHERILNATFADERSNEEFRLKERAGLRRESARMRLVAGSWGHCCGGGRRGLRSGRLRATAGRPRWTTTGR